MPPEHDRFGPPEAYGQPPRTGRFWFDFAAATAAIVISMVSVVIAVRGERTQRGLLSANAWPFAEVSLDIGGDQQSVTVLNEGVGPARLMSFTAFFNGKPVENGLDLIHQCCGLPPPPVAQAPSRDPAARGISFGEISNNVIRPGESLTWLKMRRETGNETSFDRLGAILPQPTFRACYCSILDDCWVSTLRTLHPAQVTVCPTP
jgi:hypothetical protein